jgi:hypothetical protein
LKTLQSTRRRQRCNLRRLSCHLIATTLGRFLERVKDLCRRSVWLRGRSLSSLFCRQSPRRTLQCILRARFLFGRRGSICCDRPAKVKRRTRCAIRCEFCVRQKWGAYGPFAVLPSVFDSTSGCVQALLVVEARFCRLVR